MQADDLIQQAEAITDAIGCGLLSNAQQADAMEAWKEARKIIAVQQKQLFKYHTNIDVQIFTEEDFEDENKELREYFCAICQGKLDYLKKMEQYGDATSVCNTMIRQYRTF